MSKCCVLYSVDGVIFDCGPFDDEPSAIAYVKKVNNDGSKAPEETEFDIQDTHVYLMTSDLRMTEISESDLE